MPQRKGIENMSDAGRDEWSVQELAEEGAHELTDTMQRQVLRGDETKGDPDARDVAGNVDSNETPQRREEAKNDQRSKANRNG